MSASKNKTLSQLLLSSAFSAELFAIALLGVALLVGVMFSMAQEKKQTCETARVTWALEEDKLLQIVLRDKKDELPGLIGKLDQIREQGGWGRVRIAVDGQAHNKFDSGTGTTLAFTCQAPFSYIGSVKGMYEFEYPWKSAVETLKKYLLVLLSALIGVFLIVILQRRVIRREVLGPISEIQGNLKKLAIGEPVLFTGKVACEELRDLQNSIESAFKQNQALRDEVERKKITDEINKIFIQVSHNIRNRLSSLDMEFDGAKDYLPAEKCQQFGASIDGFRELGNLLQQKARESVQILAGSGDITNLTRPNLETHPVSHLFDAVAKEVRAQIPPRISLQFQEDSSALIRTDVIEFKSMLGNLIHNSVQAISGTGTIQVRIENGGPSTVISVQDNGCGIESEDLPRLATLGESIGKPTGLGAGLFHARTNMEKWGGKFEIDSTKGVGTIIRLIFPCIGDTGKSHPC